MKLKELEKKHDHKLTECLKVIIFSLLMLAPLFASISQMIYVSFNKNAYQSYSGTTTQIVENGYQYNTNVVNDETDLIADNIYEFRMNHVNDKFSLYFLNLYIFNDDRLLLYCNDGGYIDVYNEKLELAYGITNLEYYLTNINNLTVYFTYAEDTLDITDVDIGISQYIFESDFLGDTIYSQIETSTLDNAFYYGVNQMTKSELFNWTQNTAVYTGVKAMTDNLQIQTPVVAILIVYWFILTIIYIIIDIVLGLFTKLTHFMN